MKLYPKLFPEKTRRCLSSGGFRFNCTPLRSCAHWWGPKGWQKGQKTSGNRTSSGRKWKGQSILIGWTLRTLKKKVIRTIFKTSRPMAQILLKECCWTAAVKWPRRKNKQQSRRIHCRPRQKEVAGSQPLFGCFVKCCGEMCVRVASGRVENGKTIKHVFLSNTTRPSTRVLWCPAHQCRFH